MDKTSTCYVCASRTTSRRDAHGIPVCKRCTRVYLEKDTVAPESPPKEEEQRKKVEENEASVDDDAPLRSKNILDALEELRESIAAEGEDSTTADINDWLSGLSDGLQEND